MPATGTVLPKPSPRKKVSLVNPQVQESLFPFTFTLINSPYASSLSKISISHSGNICRKAFP